MSERVLEFIDEKVYPMWIVDIGGYKYIVGEYMARYIKEKKALCKVKMKEYCGR